MIKFYGSVICIPNKHLNYVKIGLKPPRVRLTIKICNSIFLRYLVIKDEEAVFKNIKKKKNFLRPLIQQFQITLTKHLLCEISQ